MAVSAEEKESTAKRILETLHRHGHEALLAGGCVRDRLRRVAPKDFDIATSATPDEVQKIFPKTIPVGAHFGVVLVVESGTPFEVATFRAESGYQDGRRPTQVSFTGVEEDAKRRDFTVNGLYFDIRSQKVLDFVGGAADLGKKVIRTIGDARERFEEDHLRILRAARFATQLGFTIDPGVEKAMRELAPLITKVSAERVREELSKILTSARPAEGLRLLDRMGLLSLILPEVETMKGVEQPPEYHPEGDVFIHTMLLMEGMSEPPIELALGGLFHDIAKPATFERATDRIRFHGHDKQGADMARAILKRLTYPNHVIDLVCALVADHLKFKDAFQMRESTLRRFLSQDRFDLHLELHRLDCMASHKKLEAYEFCQKKLAQFAAEPRPPERLLSGSDLVALGYPTGPSMGEMLRVLGDAILEGEVKTKDEATAWVIQRYPKGKKR